MEVSSLERRQYASGAPSSRYDFSVRDEEVLARKIEEREERTREPAEKKADVTRHTVV